MPSSSTNGLRPATDEELAWARANYAKPSNDDIEIDDNAQVSEAPEGVWVQAWVYIPNED